MKLAGYMIRAPMSLEKMNYDAASGTVIYRSKMHLGLKRNFQVMPGAQCEHWRKQLHFAFLIAAALLCLAGWGLFRFGMRWAISGAAGLPLLVANGAGLRQYRYGIIPWEAVRHLAIHSYTEQNDGDELVRYWLCALVTETAFRQGVRGMGLVERLFIGSVRKRCAKTGWVLPLMNLGAGNEFGFTLNGVSMPPEKMEKILASIRKLGP